MKYQFKRKPRPYQLRALQKALQLGSMAIWFDPGLGKTKVAIDFSAIKIAKQELERILVVCPLSAIGVWEDEYPEDCPDEYMPHILPVVGDMDDRIKLLTEAQADDHPSPQCLVINYDSLRNEQIQLLLKAYNAQLLIVDEMHYTKNHSAQRSKRVRELRQLATFCLGLTGTPIPKNPLDLFGQFLIINEQIFGGDRGAYKRFRNRYAVMNYRFPSKVDKWLNIDELARKIHAWAYRAKDSECENLPELIVQDIPVYFGSKSKKAYNQMATEMIVELENEERITASMAAVKVMKLQQITGGFIMRKDEYLDETTGLVKANKMTFPVGTEKLDVCMDLVDRYVEHHKLIIGCRFVWEINQISERLTKAGIKHAIIRGGVSADERTRIKREYQDDESLRLIIFQISAATAMTLTAGNIGILYSSTQKWDDYWQWLKRLHRDGQTKPVYILRLIVKGSIDKQVVQSIHEKKDFTDCIIDRQSAKRYLKLID